MSAATFASVDLRGTSKLTMHRPHLPEIYERYFTAEPGARIISLAKLTPTKPPASQPGAVDRAEEFMRQAARGEVARRAPISVLRTSDDRYEVLDGNATFGVALRNGWHAIPAIVCNQAPAVAQPPVVAWDDAVRDPRATLERHVDGTPGYVLVGGVPAAEGGDIGVLTRAVQAAFAQLSLVSQGPDGALAHVIRAPSSSTPPGDTAHPFPASRDHMELHSDGSFLPEPDCVDYVGLACLGQARTGGGTSLLPIDALVDWIARRDSVAAARLLHPFPFAALGATESDAPLVWHPILRGTARGPIGRVHRYRNYRALDQLAAPLDPIGARALELLGEALQEADGIVRFRLAPGELLLLDNRRVLHGRDAFDDGSEGEQRQLLRFWFRRAEMEREGQK